MTRLEIASNNAAMVVVELDDDDVARVHFQGQMVYMGPAESAVKDAGVAFARMFFKPLLYECQARSEARKSKARELEDS